MTHAHTLWLRAELVRLLAAADGSLSSAALAAQLPWHTERLDLGCGLLCRAPNTTAADLVVIECHQSWHLVRRPRSSQDANNGIYRHLKSLARTGVIRQINLGARRVEWEFIGEDTPSRQVYAVSSATREGGLLAP